MQTDDKQTEERGAEFLGDELDVDRLENDYVLEIELASHIESLRQQYADEL